MKLEIAGWRFSSKSCKENRLILRVNWFSTMQVCMSKEGKPEFSCYTGKLKQTGLPQDVEQELSEAIQEMFPRGIRPDLKKEVSRREWTERKLRVIQWKDKDLRIKSLKESRTVVWRGKKYKVFMADAVVLEDETEVMILPQPQSNQIAIFCMYVTDSDVDQYPDDLRKICCVDFEKGFARMKLLIQKFDRQMTLYDQFVLSRDYLFDEKGRLEADMTLIRNDHYGETYFAKPGKYLVTVANLYRNESR